MDDYISKPLTIEALRAVLVRATQVGPALSAHPEPRRLTPGVRIQPEVARLFLQEASSRLEDVRDALSRRDPTALARAAHRLRGAVSNFGPSEALAMAAELESMAERGGQAAQGAWTECEERFGRLAVALTALLGTVGRAQ